MIVVDQLGFGDFWIFFNINLRIMVQLSLQEGSDVLWEGYIVCRN